MSEKAKLSNVIGALVVSVLLTPVSAIIMSFYCLTLWGWFLEPQYGDGPSRMGWFGIGALVTLLTWKRDRDQEDKEAPRATPVWAITEWIQMQLIILLMFGMVAFTRFVLGW